MVRGAIFDGQEFVTSLFGEIMRNPAEEIQEIEKLKKSLEFSFDSLYNIEESQENGDGENE